MAVTANANKNTVIAVLAITVVTVASVIWFRSKNIETRPRRKSIPKSKPISEDDHYVIDINEDIPDCMEPIAESDIKNEEVSVISKSNIEDEVSAEIVVKNDAQESVPKHVDLTVTSTNTPTKIEDASLIDINRKDRSVFYIGTRQSELALAQAIIVQKKLIIAFPEYKFEIRSMSTKGDRILDVNLNKIGGKSLFTKDLEDKLSEGWCDLIVHSLKDVPTELHDSFTLAGIMQRENPRDVVILSSSAKDAGIKTLRDLPPGSVIGTSSVRRVSQIKRLYPRLKVSPCRGNLNTRLKKLDGEYVPKQQENEQKENDKKNNITFNEEAEGKENSLEKIAEIQHYDAIVLAYAGVHRLGWDDRISQILDPDDGMLYAVGQGCLGLECRVKDKLVVGFCEVLSNNEAKFRAQAERAFMERMDGSCSTPIGVHTEYETKPNGAGKLILTGAIFSESGRHKYACTRANHNIESADDARQLGINVATEVFKQIKEDYPDISDVKDFLYLAKRESIASK